MFHSRREAQVYCQLKAQQQAGLVREIQLQPRFELQPAPHRITYIADFRVLYATGAVEILDVKGMVTDAFSIKKRLFLAKYPALTLRMVK